MVFTFCNAFKPLDELFRFPPTIIVRNPTLANFKSISTLMSSSWVPFSRYIFNTVFVTVVATGFDDGNKSAKDKVDEITFGGDAITKFGDADINIPPFLKGQEN